MASSENATSLKPYNNEDIMFSTCIAVQNSQYILGWDAFQELETDYTLILVSIYALRGLDYLRASRDLQTQGPSFNSRILL